MAELKVPLALTQAGKVIHPESAEKGVGYFCPGCEDQLVFKKGGEKKPHFSHKSSDVCTNETITHKLAKQIIVEVITSYLKTSKDAPIIHRDCPFCGTTQKERLDYALPFGPTSVETEVQLKSGFIVDVAVFSGQSPIFAIEVYVTHAVDEAKAAAICIPFIELAGESVIESPRNWLPIKSNVAIGFCEVCSAAKTAFKRTLADIANSTAAVLKHELEGFVECGLCHRIVLVAEHCPFCNNRLKGGLFQPLFSGPFCWVVDKDHHIRCMEGQWVELCALPSPKGKSI